MINTEVEPICGQGAYLISLVSLSMKNSITCTIKLPLRGTKRVYFGAKLRLPKQIQYCLSTFQWTHSPAYDHFGKSACQLFNETWDTCISKGNIGNPLHRMKISPICKFAAQ